MDALNPFVLWSGYDRLARQLAGLRRLDLDPLFEKWLDIIVEDNRVGVLSGLDKDGKPLAQVTYRTGAAHKARFRRGEAMGSRVGRFKGRRKGGMNTRFQVRLANNNLSTAEYKALGGPPLAPRSEHSRVISNLHKKTPRRRGGVWEVACAWVDVLDPKGRPLLPRHFNGEKGLPVRDLRGVRLQGMNLAGKALEVFVRNVLNGMR